MPTLIAVFALSVVACGNPRDEFVGFRVEDTCDGQWPVCDTVVGCVLADRSYLSGRFPGRNRFIARLAEPSEVKVTFFLEETSGSGDNTAITLYEDRCRARVRYDISGRLFVAESQRTGKVSRQADLVGLGDHLIEVESDSRTRYLLKVDILPLRLRE
jgi:hypothetical protein